MSKLADEYEGLPYYGQQRLPITAAIPYFYRWKINNLKLMLNDLKELKDKHDIFNAGALYDLIALEANDICISLYHDIYRIRNKRKQLAMKDVWKLEGEETT